MLKRYRSAAVAMAALLITSGAVFAAGNWSTLPIIEGGSFCASTVTGTGSLGGITGQGQGSTGSICAQTVPAGPTAVTGSELVPADTGLGANGGGPATAMLQMVNLNALPLTISTVLTSPVNTLSATNLTGGFLIHNTSGTVSAVTISLPPAPVDGQQFAISGDQTVTTLIVTASAGQTITKSPTVLTSSTTATYGYRFLYNAAGTNWYRLN